MKNTFFNNILFQITTQLPINIKKEKKTKRKRRKCLFLKNPILKGEESDFFFFYDIGLYFSTLLFLSFSPSLFFFFFSSLKLILKTLSLFFFFFSSFKLILKTSLIVILFKVFMEFLLGL